MERSRFQEGLIGWLSRGLPLVERPYLAIAEDLGVGEDVVIDGIRSLQEQGFLNRFGVVVRHHELGYRANAMVVWDVPDEVVTDIGQAMGRYDFVTLCYRRPRRPGWRYNLFCMIHGKSRELTEERVAQISSELGLEEVSHELLFSTRRFKQNGALYGAATTPVTS